MEPRTTLNVASEAQVFQINAIKSPGGTHINLHNQIVGAGAIGLLLPKGMFPFVAEGDSVLVSVTVTRVAIVPEEPSKGLIIPGKH